MIESQAARNTIIPAKKSTVSPPQASINLAVSTQVSLLMMQGGLASPLRNGLQHDLDFIDNQARSLVEVVATEPDFSSTVSTEGSGEPIELLKGNELELKATNLRTPQLVDPFGGTK